MSTVDKTPGKVAVPLSAEARAEQASERLVRNRQRLAGWLEQNRRDQATRGPGGWVLGALWPVLKGLQAQPVAMLALGALAKRYALGSPVAAAAPMELQVMGTALAVVRRHPKLSLTVAAAAGATWLWCRWRSNQHP